jgi:hypothetical protein
MYAKLAIGLPTHRPIAFTVRQNAFDSNGAWSKVPITGRTHVVMKLEDIDHGYQSFPVPQTALQPSYVICVLEFESIRRTGPV